MRTWIFLLCLVGCAAEPEKQFVLFEFFGRQACGICKEAGPVANQLLREMEAKGEPVLFLGYDVGPYEEPNPDLGERRKRWRQVFGDKSALLPLIMLQSGAEVTQGRHKDFHDKYLSMIRSAQQKRPTAQLNASLKQEEQTLTASIHLRNTGEATLSDQNKASVRLFFYDDATTIHLAHTPRVIETIPLIEPVKTDQEVSFRLVLHAPKEIDAASLHLAVVVEHHDTNGRWTIAQGAFAKETNPSAVEQMLSLIWASL